MFKIILFSSFISIALCATDSSDYGYFDVGLNNVKTCQGPKRKNCCFNSVNIQNGSIIIYDFVVKDDVAPTKGKIVASLRGKQMLRLQMDKPCEHVFIRPFLKTLLNATEGCVIMKSEYHFTLDIGEVFQTYYSGMFLYGNWTFKSMFWSEDCNFLCTITEINLTPKTTSKE